MEASIEALNNEYEAYEILRYDHFTAKQQFKEDLNSFKAEA